jgi:NADPH2:quinone reductase
MKAIVVSRFGGPEVLELADVPEPELVEGEVLYEITATAVNFADTHQTEGSYLRQVSLPFTPGMDFVGHNGDGARVLGKAAGGTYAERIALLPMWTWPIPDDVSDPDALALAVHGATAWHLLRTLGRLGKGDSVLVHAGAGGVGSFAVQLAKRWGGGRVIATASSEEKRRVALDLGADAAVDSTLDDLAPALLEANNGAAIDLVLEMTGGRVFDQSLGVLAPFGRLVVYGTASTTPTTPIQAESLMDSSRTISGFWIRSLLAPKYRPAFDAALFGLFRMVAKGELTPLIGGRYPLADACRAHEELRARRTVGVQILDVAT